MNTNIINHKVIKMDNLDKEEKFRKYAKQMTLSFAGVYEKDNCLYDIETSRGLSLDGKSWRKQGSGNLIEYSDYISIKFGSSALKTHLLMLLVLDQFQK